MRGIFVTGTDTGVGKSVVSAALACAMAADGLVVRAHKPVLTGLAQPPGEGEWPADHELLAMAAGTRPEQVSPLRFAAAASPHLAAALEGERIAPAALLARARAAAEGCDAVIVEGVGGLLVPLAGAYTVRELAAELRLPLLVVARPGLGTINHTLLTLHAARAMELAVLAVVLTPWPNAPSALERSNLRTIAELGAVAVHTLAHVAHPRRTELARAGATLPWREWLAG